MSVLFDWWCGQENRRRRCGGIATVWNGVSCGVAAVREGGSRGVGADRPQSGATDADQPGQRVSGASRRARSYQREWTSLRDLATHARQVPRHSAWLRREGVLLRWPAQRVLLRQRSGTLPLRAGVLSHRKTALPKAGTTWRYAVITSS